MTQPQGRFRWLAAGALPAVSAAALMVMSAGSASAAGGVTGSAFGYQAGNVTLFGGAQNPVGPTPAVSLAADASNSPQTGSATTGIIQYGPATLFTSDAITVKTSGSSTSVQSTSTVNDINKATTQSSTGSEELTANALASTCSSSGTGNTGSTTATSATVATLSGAADPNPPTVTNVPANPAPNTAITGQIEISSTDTESFKFVFNEQTTSNGVLTVNAVDEYLLGPTAKGNVILGQVQCGLSGTAASGASGSSGVSTPGTGGGAGWLIGAPIVVAGAGVLAGTAVAIRRRHTRGKEERPD